jgi:hypothetical protein
MIAVSDSGSPRTIGAAISSSSEVAPVQYGQPGQPNLNALVPQPCWHLIFPLQRCDADGAKFNTCSTYRCKCAPLQAA